LICITTERSMFQRIHPAFWNRDFHSDTHMEQPCVSHHISQGALYTQVILNYGFDC